MPSHEPEGQRAAANYGSAYSRESRESWPQGSLQRRLLNTGLVVPELPLFAAGATGRATGHSKMPRRRDIDVIRTTRMGGTGLEPALALATGPGGVRQLRTSEHLCLAGISGLERMARPKCRNRKSLHINRIWLQE